MYYINKTNKYEGDKIQQLTAYIDLNEDLCISLV